MSVKFTVNVKGYIIIVFWTKFNYKIGCSFSLMLQSYLIHFY